MELGGQHHAPAALSLCKRPGTRCTGAWVGPRAGLDWCRKSRLPPGFDPRTVSSVTILFSDNAIPAPKPTVESYRKQTSPSYHRHIISSAQGEGSLTRALDRELQ